MRARFDKILDAPHKITIFIIAAVIALAISSVLFAFAFRNSEKTKRENEVAQSLLREGIELFSKIRDTNLRRFPSKVSVCWSTKLEHTELATCDDPKNKIADGAYKTGNYDDRKEDNLFRVIQVRNVELKNPADGADALAVTVSVFFPKNGEKSLPLQFSTMIFRP